MTAKKIWHPPLIYSLLDVMCSVHISSSLGRTLISASTLAFVLIGKYRPHRIMEKTLGNMNLVIGSKVALLGFWELGLLVTKSHDSAS